MQTRRAVLMKLGQDPHHCEVGCPDPRSTRPFEHVFWGLDLFIRTEISDQHDEQGRICAYRYVEHYEV